MCFEMVTGDMIAITIERTSGTGKYWYIGTIYDAGNGAYRLKSGYLTGDTAISSWNTNDNVLLQMKYIYFA
jgi:hypothetical protein